MKVEISENNAFQTSPSPLDSSASPGAPQSPGDSASHGGQSSDTPLTKVQSAPGGANNFPAPKTDKPRPHVCGTCGRSFARLEHLKRHERSHTKEKPFECPECTRCFARRDLLLRHQQKLHLTTAPSSRSNKARRESNASNNGVNPSAKIRKSSTNGSNGATSANTMRPRANTISHVDGTTLNMLASVNRSMGSNGDFDMSMDHSSDVSMGAGHQTYQQHLPRLTTQGLSMDNGESSLRTAPAVPGMNPTFGFDQSGSAGSTVNPAQLHLENSLDPSTSNFSQHLNSAVIEEEDNLDWLRGFTAQMNFNGANDQVIGASSPSVMSHGSNGALGEFVSDSSGGMNQSNNMIWQAHLQRHGSGAGHFGMESNMSMHQDMGLHMGQMQSSAMHGNMSTDHFYTSPAVMMFQQRPMNGISMHMPAPMNFSSDGNSISSSSGNGSARHSSITSVSTDTITETTRQALIHSLSQPSVFGRGNRKYSQPAISSPLSPRDQTKQSGNGPSLPSTADLQRYVNAYIQYFHPHFPFLHIPTLSFDTPACNNNLRPASSSGSALSQGGMVGGGGCLVLAMAAIGALYELERPVSRELFESAKKMIQLYLEERRNSDKVPSSKSGYDDQSAQNTPLWLVQAMLLNVIYGHNCGDKISGEIASTHCSALVSLARAAGLHLPLSEESINTQNFQNGHGMPHSQDVHMGNDGAFQEPWNVHNQNETEHSQWVRWIIVEERKRTLFAIFHMSSLLVSAYNHAPALMNSEVHLDLPCEEDLWCAETASAWVTKGGAEGARQRALPFANALATLLTASQGNQEHQALSHEQPFGSGIPLADLPPSSMRPSTFGCLVLINALHNYIWETRQRHSGRQWTTQETESMHAHIEPALRAWQAAWASNPTHSLERPNPFGLGPLSADSIPLLDLAYVRLFVNLGMSKEAFWQRDFNAMSEELARGSEFVQHADYSENSAELNNASNESRSSPMPNGVGEIDISKIDNQEALTVPPPQAVQAQHRSSKRERHLRKAAFYAADSLSMSDKLGVTFADFTSRELPVQSALCTFDCAQVLAEWVATVQERVGQYLGILGRDAIEYGQVPAIMLLEDEDCKLLEKVSDILRKAEAKMTFEIDNIPATAAMTALQRLPSVSRNGFGSKILLVTAHMLERAAVWPVTNTMAHGLEIQAQHMQTRAESSVLSQTN